MSMVTKNISLTDQQDSWIKARVESGYFCDASDLVRTLITERQLQEQETPEQIEATRAALIEGEQGGFTDQSIEEVWEEALRDMPQHEKIPAK